MNEENGNESDVQEVPEAVVHTRKHHISIVWLVPIVALIIGGWLAYKALSEKGPVITIVFRTAEGLEVFQAGEGVLFQVFVLHLVEGPGSEKVPVSVKKRKEL